MRRPGAQGLFSPLEYEGPYGATPATRHDLSALVALNPSHTRSRASRLAKRGSFANHFWRRIPLELTTRNATPLPPSSNVDSSREPSDRTMADRPARPCEPFLAFFATFAAINSSASGYPMYSLILGQMPALVVTTTPRQSAATIQSNP